MAVDSRQFRSALGCFATGLTIVTTRAPCGTDVGLTVNSFNSVSLDPPMVLWSLAKTSRSRQTFIDTGYFAVHILASEQSDLATRFASHTERFRGLPLDRSEQGLPLLQGCAARFLCKVVWRYDGGDHDIFVGEVTTFEHFERPPLVLQAGRYVVAVEKPEPIVADPEAEKIGVERNSITYLLVQTSYRLQHSIRPELSRHRLSEIEHFILAGVALMGPCSLSQVRNRIAISGYQVTDTEVRRLTRKGLLSISSDAMAEPAVHLTDAGREIVLRIAAMTKAIEEDAVSHLNPTEIDVLKQMLRNIVRRIHLSWQNDPIL